MNIRRYRFSSNDEAICPQIFEVFQPPQQLFLFLVAALYIFSWKRSWQKRQKNARRKCVEEIICFETYIFTCSVETSHKLTGALRRPEKIDRFQVETGAVILKICSQF